jgi:hypothetical protein
LEDIAQLKCFEVLDRLRAELAIPVWHNDQQGTAMVLLAGLLNALKVVGKSLDRVRIGMIGAGAANIAVYRTLRSSGVPSEAVIMCDSKGILHRGRSDLEQRQAQFKDKWRVCSETNPEQRVGGVERHCAERMCALHFPRRVRTSLYRKRSRPRRRMPLFLRAPTQCLKYGHGMLQRPERGSSQPAAATSRIR